MSEPDRQRSGLRDATLCVTRVELNSRTGGGVILTQIFAREPAFAVLYSLEMFNGESAGDIAWRILQRTANPADAVERVAAALDGHEIARIFCAPQHSSDVLSAMAAADLTQAPLVTYFMDDSNVFRGGISDAEMRALIGRSAICFAISPVLCEVYEQKFGDPIWLLPPVNDARLFAPPGLAPPVNARPRGVVIGNVWSPDVVADLRSTVRQSGLRIDWYGNAGRPFIDLDPAELAADGIDLHPNLADSHLVRELRSCDFAIMPSRTLDRDHPQDFLYRASLPSRLVYLFTTAHLPIVVLGSADTAAGRFVSQFGLGAVAAYDAGEFADAVARITSTPEREAIRTRAAELSPSFAAEPVADWLWRSAALGRPADERYERLFAMDRG